MRRRDFMQLIAFYYGFLASSFPIRPKAAGHLPDRSSFLVAGARFSKLTEALRSGDRVVIEAEVFRQQRCYGVFTVAGQRIGYVPRTLIPSLNKCQVVESYLSSVDQHAVPWKRYEVTLVSNPLA
jgi:hypothetical protein